MRPPLAAALVLLASEIASPLSVSYSDSRFLLYLVIFPSIVNELPLFLKRAAKIRTFSLRPNFFLFFFIIFQTVNGLAWLNSLINMSL